MIRPGTFERVYAAIKLQLRQGMFRPGDRLEPAILSAALNASVTPVRDALHRLTGERLVEAPRHDGFRVPALTEATLRHLYAWHRDLLLLAIANRQPAVCAAADRMPPSPAAAGPAERHNALFLLLARMTGNPEHVLALESLIERLEPVQRLECVLLDAIEEESGDISTAIRTQDGKMLRRCLIRYHRRRARIVPELLERLQHEGEHEIDAASFPRR